MTYIGSEPNYGALHSQTITTANGSTATFTLDQYVPDSASIIVTIGNVVQEPTTAYTASGNSITFTENVPNGDTIVVRYLGRSVDVPTTYKQADRFKFVATNAQTTFTGADANSLTLAYTTGNIDVFLNGVRLDESDFTASNGTSVVLGSGAATNDELVIIAYRTVQISNALDKTAGGTVAGATTFNGDVTISAGTSGDAVLTIEADTDNNNEGDHPEILFKQDGGLPEGGIKLADNETVMWNSVSLFGGLSFKTGTGNSGYGDATERMRINSSGNVGIGITPESWHSNWTAIDFGNRGAIGQYKTDGDTQLMFNTYHDGAWKIKETGQAGRYVIGGVTDLYHIWYTGTNANTDATTTFTERMRLDAAGNLGLGHAPYAHHANWSHIDIGEKCGIGHYHGGDTAFTHNNYYDGTWKAKETGVATQLNLTAAGEAIFRYADSTSAGSTISWQQCLRINTDGTVLVGEKDVNPNNAWAFRAFNTHATHATIEGWNDNSGGKNLNLFRHDDASIFQVSNGGAVWAAGGYTSDKAFKNVIGDCTEGWSKLKDVQPKSYRYKNIHYEEKDGEEVEVFGDDDLDSNIHYGVIAQDLKKVLPDITYGEEGKMSVDYHGLLMVAINTIKELEARIKVLEDA